MTVYSVSGATLILDGDGTTKVDEITVADVLNPITGAAGPVFVKITNSSTTDTATVGWTPTATAPEYAYPGEAGTASGSGTNQEFTVTVTINGYEVEMTNPGEGFVAADTVTIAGTDLGGATPANDWLLQLIQQHR